jgi:hypothetical protein
MKHLVILLIVTAICIPAFAKDECQQTATYKIYSNAFLSQETGDVGGYELALKPPTGDSYEALLYVYEGVPTLAGIPLVGNRHGASVSLEGDWRQELVEYPSKRNITQTLHVRLKGRISGSHFRGAVQIDQDSSPLLLKLVNHTWLCSPQAIARRSKANDDD